MFTTLPNRLSLLRMILSPVFFVLFISSTPFLRHISLAVFLVAAITDWYDGVIARRSNSVTKLGKFLDPLADKFLTSAAFFAFAAVHLVAWWMVWAIVVRDIVITVLRSVAEARDAEIVTTKTAQTKTFVQMIVLYYVLLLVVGHDIRWMMALFGTQMLDAMLEPSLLYWLMLAVTVLTLFTGLQYLYDNRKFLVSLFAGRSRVAD
jgi:CDP-diacylglycerol---glycerol-3-phosphate 3-phosphatidyltransferase